MPKNLRKFARTVLTIVMGFALLLGAYFSFWSVKYRVPCSPTKVLDHRNSPTDKPYCISFCASLANNPTGFPGHAYVVFSDSPNVDPEHDESYGQMPRLYKDQVKAIFKSVNGSVLKNIRGNTENLDRLTVMVSESDYRTVKSVVDMWSGLGGANNFKVGQNDCVTFTNFVAVFLGLNTPFTNGARGALYPQDYLRELKALN